MHCSHNWGEGTLQLLGLRMAGSDTNCHQISGETDTQPTQGWLRGSLELSELQSGAHMSVLSTPSLTYRECTARRTAEAAEPKQDVPRALEDSPCHPTLRPS